MATPTIAVLAGGLATRLGELTKRTPKSMLEVCGRPFLAWQLELFARNGLNDVVLCVGHHADQITSWVASHANAGLRVRVVHDGDRQLGTGGALMRALPMLGDPFLVTYGDSYLRCDYQAVFRAFQASQRALGLMTVFENEGKWDTSNVLYRDGRIARYDKRERVPEMRHIDWGLGVLTHEAFAPYRAGERLDLADVYARLVGSQQLAGFEVTERFYEIGSHTGLDEFRGLVAAGGAQ